MIGKPVTNRSTRWEKIQSRGVVGWVNADYLAPSHGGQDIQPTVLPAVSNVGPTSEGRQGCICWLCVATQHAPFIVRPFDASM